MKVSPAQLMFGNAIVLDRDILIPADEHLLPAKSLTRSLDSMLHTQQNLICISRELLLQSDKEHNKEFRESITEFAIGSQPRTQPATRMHTPWTGPYKVITFQKGQYKVLDLITNKHKCTTFHNSSNFITIQLKRILLILLEEIIWNILLKKF
jgi:hypothetical protein